MMVSHGLLARLDAKAGKEADVERFLQSAWPLARQEPGTTAWFALRFGRGEYGIFDVFPDAAARDAHLAGAIATALMEEADNLLAKQPAIHRLDVLAEKLVPLDPAEVIAKALLLTFKAKSGHAEQVAQFLRDAQAFVEEEHKTLSWFAIHLDNGDYGIFDAFRDNAGRFTHLTGHVPRELGKHALSLLGSVPDISMIDVLAAKAPTV